DRHPRLERVQPVDRLAAPLGEALPAAGEQRPSPVLTGRAEHVDVSRSRELGGRSGEGRTPDPFHVGRAGGGAYVVDVAPRLLELSRMVAVGVVVPGEPVAVHLLSEAEEHRVLPTGQRTCPGPDIGVELAVDDVAQPVARLRLVQALAGVPRLPGDLRRAA